MQHVRIEAGRATGVVLAGSGAVVDLPGVGQNLVDHPAVSVDLKLDGEVVERRASRWSPPCTAARQRRQARRICSSSAAGRSASRAHAVAADPALRAVSGARLTPELSGEELRTWLRQSVWTYHHPVGTCRMGIDPDDGAVVDATGRVFGVDDLYVIDASIMPDVPSANTNLPTIMVAERLAAEVAVGATGSGYVWPPSPSGLRSAGEWVIPAERR